MRSALRYFVTKQPVAFGIFAAALLLVLFFAGKFLLHFDHFREHVPMNQALEPWMRPRYVAMSYRVPPKVMREEILRIGPPPKERGREPVTMDEIAARKGIALDALTEQVRAGAAAFHDGRSR